MHCTRRVLLLVNFLHFPNKMWHHEAKITLIELPQIIQICSYDLRISCSSFNPIQSPLTIKINNPLNLFAWFWCKLLLTVTSHFITFIRNFELSDLLFLLTLIFLSNTVITQSTASRQNCLLTPITNLWVTYNLINITKIYNNETQLWLFTQKISNTSLIHTKSNQTCPLNNINTTYSVSNSSFNRIASTPPSPKGMCFSASSSKLTIFW